MSEVNWFENTELSYAEFMLNNWRKRPAVFEKGLESISQKLSSDLIYKEIIDSDLKIDFKIRPEKKNIFKTRLTNLFKKSAGWKWVDGPVEYKDIPTLVSVQNKGKHYYALEANFPEGVNLTRYANSPSEPRLRPTVKGFVDLGKQIGKISVRGKEHPVYDKIVNRYAGGSVVERNPYANYQPKAI